MKIYYSSKKNLNNKGRLDSDICCVFMYVFVGLSGLDLRNGATYEYEICTAYSCDDSTNTQAFFFNYV